MKAKMKWRATRLLLISALVMCSLFASGQATDQSPQSGQSASQEQSPQPNQAPGASEPTATAPAQDSSSSVKPPAVEPDNSSGSKAEPAPKPPVLRHHRRKAVSKKNTKHACSATAEGGPKKVVVKNGGEKDASAQLAPGINPDQAKKQRVSTEQLLAATDENLNRVNSRTLSQAEQSTVDKIHAYMRQAKAASASGDTNRAQTLAYKARQLSDDLARK